MLQFELLSILRTKHVMRYNMTYKNPRINITVQTESNLLYYIWLLIALQDCDYLIMLNILTVCLHIVYFQLISCFYSCVHCLNMSGLIAWKDAIRVDGWCYFMKAGKVIEMLHFTFYLTDLNRWSMQSLVWRQGENTD